MPFGENGDILIVRMAGVYTMRMTQFPQEVSPAEFINALLMIGYSSIERAQAKLYSLERDGVVLLTNRFTVTGGSSSVEEAFVSIVAEMEPERVEETWRKKFAVLAAFDAAVDEGVRRADIKKSNAA